MEAVDYSTPFVAQRRAHHGAVSFALISGALPDSIRRMRNPTELRYPLYEGLRYYPDLEDIFEGA
jgi:hypothetical protein